MNWVIMFPFPSLHSILFSRAKKIRTVDICLLYWFFISKFISIFIETLVPAPIQEIDEEQYATYVRTIRVGAQSDKILRVLLPTRKERKKFFDTYGSLVTCRPPPVFMVLFVILQIAMFVFYYVRSTSSWESIGQDAMDSMWIYDPYKVCTVL